MENVNIAKQAEEESAEAVKPTTVPEKSPGSVTIEIREVDISRPVRTVNRMWPNR